MAEEILGNIHSLESCGTVDGPGVRFVVFTQGCPLRCKYCHNPDSWVIYPLQGRGQGEGFTKEISVKQMTVKQILDKYDGVKEFCKGGITVTGGEPLLQMDFVTELFRAAKEKNIHTALDTSGIVFNPNDTSKVDEVLKYTDLVLLDIKHINNEEHKKLTGLPNENILAFAKYLSDIEKPVWIRHVVVPGITYNPVYLRELGRFLKGLKNLKALDVLPYHDMAIPKYENLGIDYPLKGVPPLSKGEALNARNLILEGFRE